ncbi:MAG: hypothetical protein IKA48_00175 [Fibrobacter sp.]|nr:hypothetical protein [Fibrobacter sp.]
MKTFKFMKALYVATYLGIIALAIFKIVSKVKGCPCDKCREKRPLFESAEKSKEADRMLTIRGGSGIEYDHSAILATDNSAFRRKEMNIFVGEPNIGKKMLEMAETAGKIPEEHPREVTLARHRELDEALKDFAKKEQTEQSIKDFFNA